MNDVTTQKPLRVSTDGTAGPYIMVPVAQLSDLCRLLDQHTIRYSIDEDAISLNDEPLISVVNLGRRADPAAIQAMLDSSARPEK